MSPMPPPPPGNGTPPPPPPPPPGGHGYPSPPVYGQAPTTKPDSYLLWAILATLLCCLPLGVVSIVYAARVDSQWSAGDYHGAAESSAKAKKFAIASAAVSAVFLFGWVVVTVLASTASTV